MGVFKQLFQLFWKNYVLRKRKPIVLLLEILWPLLIFAIVVIIRRGSLPMESETCTYQERALPSAGMVPFLQSAACTLNNPCGTQEAMQAKLAQQQRLSSMLKEIDPILQKDTTKAALDALPTFDVLVDVLKNVSNTTDLSALEEDLRLKNMFRDEEEMIDVLVNQMGLMSDLVARDLMNSSINLLSFMQAFGTLSFKEVSCDPELLVEHVIFTRDADIEKISESLCNIDDNLIPNVTDTVVKQLDIANIIHIGEAFAAYTGEFDISTLLGDLAMMADMFMKSPNIMESIGGLEDLASLPDLLKTMSSVFSQLEKMQSLDIESIANMVDLMKPIAMSMGIDGELIDAMQQFLNMSREVSLNLDPETMDLEKVFEKLTPMFEQLANSTLQDALQPLMDWPLEDIGTVTSGLQGITENMTDTALYSSMLQVVLSSVMDPQMMDQFLLAGDTLMKAANKFLTYNIGLEEEMQTLFKDNDDLTSAMTAIIDLGPEMTQQLLEAFIKPQTLQRLLLDPIQTQSVCIETIDSVTSGMDPAMVTQLKGSVCASSVTTAMQNLLSNAGYDSLLTTMIESVYTLDNIMQGKDNNTEGLTVHNLTETFTELVNTQSYMMETMGSNWMQTVEFWMDEAKAAGSEEWDNTWVGVSYSYLQSYMVVMMQNVGPELEKTSMWDTLGPAIRAADVMMEAMEEQQKTMDAMSSGDSVMGQLMSYAEYLPDIMAGAMKDMDMITERIEYLASGNGTEVLFCDDQILKSFNLSSEVPVADIENFLCTTNWTEFGLEMVSLYDMSSAFQEVEIILDESKGVGNAPGYDWSRLEQMSDTIMNMMTNPNMLTTGPWSMIEKMNFTTLGQSLERMINSTIAQMTVEMAQDYGDITVMTLAQLDASLQNISYWRYAKYYMNAWMAYTKIMDDYLTNAQGGNVNLTEYINQLSPTLGTYLMDSPDITTEVLDSITAIASNPQEVLAKVFTFNWENVCNGTSLNGLLNIPASTNFTEFEDGLCALNWTAVMEEVLSRDPDLLDNYEQLFTVLSADMSDLPDVKVNWTELAEVSSSFIESLAAPSNMTDTLFSVVPGMDTIDVAWKDLVAVFNMSDEVDLTRLSVVIDQAMASLGMFGNDSNQNESTLITMLMEMNNLFMYTNYHSLIFMNQHLAIFNSSEEIDLKTYFQSEELNKLIRVTEMSTELNMAVLQNMMEALRDSTKMAKLFTLNWTAACEDLQLFGTVFSLPGDSNMTLADLQSTACGVNIDYDKLYQELRQNVQGFAAFADAMAAIDLEAPDFTIPQVNFSSWVTEYNRTQILLEDLFTHPPRFLMTWPDSDQQLDALLQQFTDLATQISGDLGNDSSIMTTIDQLQGQAMEVLNSLLPVDPAISGMMNIADYFMTLLDDRLQKANGSIFDIEAMLTGYPEMTKLLALMDDLPELYLTYTYTSLNEQEKVTLFTTLLSQDMEQLCSVDPDLLMTVPPNVNFNFTSFLGSYCDINMAAFMTEIGQFSGFGTELDQLLQNLGNMTAPNMTELTETSNRLSDSIVKSIDNMNLTENLPRFLDAALWEDTLLKLSTLLPNYTSTDAVGTAQDIQKQMIDALSSMLPASPELSSMVSIMEYLLKTMDDRLQMANGSIFDIEAMLTGYPEMTKLLALMDDLPELYLTYTYTSLNEQEKVTLFTTLLSQDMEQLCSVDPDLLMTVPPNVNFNFTSFLKSYCDINMAALMTEVGQFSGVGTELDQLLQNLGNTTAPNMTELAEISNRLSESVMESLTNMNLTENLPRFLDAALWEDTLLKLSSLLPNYTTTDAVGTVQDIQKQMFDALSSMLPISPELSYMVHIMEYVLQNMDERLQLANGSIFDIESMTVGYPEMQKLWALMDDIPELYLTYTYTSLNDQEKISEFTRLLSEGTDALCAADPDSLMTVPPSVNFDFKQFFQSFCDINMTALVPEMSMFSGFDADFFDFMGQLENMTAPNMTQLMELNDRVSASILESFTNMGENSSLPRFMDSTVWEDTLSQLGSLMPNYSSPDAAIDAAREGQQAIMNSISQLMTEDMSDMLHIYNHFLKTLDARINMSNGNILDIDAMIRNYPQLQKLWALLDDLPELYLTYTYTSMNEPEKVTRFTNLLTNGTDQLCAADPDSLMTVPPDVTFDFPRFFTAFCEINMTSLVTELSAFSGFGPDFTSLLENMANMTAPNMAQLSTSTESIYTRLMDSFTNMNDSLDVPRFLNSDIWDETLSQLASLLPNDTAAALSQTPDTFALLEDENMAKIVATMNLILDVTLDRLQDLNGNVTRDVLVRNSNQLRTALDILASLYNDGAEELVNTTIDFDKLVNALNDPDLIQTLCDMGTLADYISTEDVADNVTKNMQDFMCLNWDTINQDLQYQIELQRLQEEIQKIWNSSSIPTPDWLAIGNKIQNITMIMIDLQQSELTLDPSVLNWFDFNNTFDALTESFMDPTSYMDALAMLDTYDLDVGELPYIMNVMLAVQKHMDRQLQILQNNNWKIPFSTILPNSEEIASFLQETLGEQSSASMFLSFVNPDKFLSMSFSTDWVNIACDPVEFHQTFEFPDDVDSAAVQTDLCADAQKQESAMRQLLDTLNMKDVLTEIENWMSMKGQSSMANVTSIGQEMFTYFEKFMGYIEQLQNYDNFDIEDWMQPILETLGAMSTTTTNSSIASCERTQRYVAGTTMYQEDIKPTLDTINSITAITYAQFLLIDEYTDVMCTKDKPSTAEGLQQLRDGNFYKVLTWLTELYSGNDTDALQFTCSNIYSYSNGITQLTDKLTRKLSEDAESYLQCYMTSLEQLGAISQDVSSLMGLSDDILQTLNDVDLASLMNMTSNDGMIALAEYGLAAFNQEESIADLIASLQENITSIEDFFRRSLSLAPDAVNSLLNSSFSLDVENMTASELIAEVCDPGQNSDNFGIPGLPDNSLANLTSVLCSGDREDATAVADALLQLAKLSTDLSSVENFDANEWWQRIVTDFSDLVGNIEDLSYLASLLGELENFNIDDANANGELLNNVQRILVDSGPERLVESFNAILKNFEELDLLDTTAEGILADVQVLTKGLLSFTTLRNLVVTNFRIQELLKDPQAFENYMVAVLNMDREVAQSIREGSISFEMLLNIAQMDVTEWVCNSTKLAELLEMHGTDVNTAHVSEAVCHIDTDTASKLVDEVLMRLDIGEIMKEMIVNGIGSILADSDLTTKKVRDDLKSITDAKDDFKELFTVLENHTSKMEGLVELMAKAHGSEALQSISPLLCGNDIQSIMDSFSFGTVVSSDDELTDEQKTESASLPGEFCQDMYKEIMSAPEGPIVWGYLKPILRGKILVAPDTPEVRTIIEQLNSSFASIETTRETMGSWALGVGVLDKTNEVQDLLQNDFIQSMMTAMSGVSGDELLNSIYSFNDTDPQLLTGVRNGAQLLVDYVGCVELDRFEFLPSEHALESKARELIGNHDLLAGIVFTNMESQARRKRAAGSDIPKHIMYKIRMDIDNVQHTIRDKRLLWTPVPEDSFAEDLRYFRGFIHLQDLLDRAIITIQTGNDDAYPAVSAHQFPFPCHKADPYLSALSGYLLPVLMTFAWIAGLAVAINNLVSDREHGQEQTLQLMGLSSVMSWLAWFLTTILIMSFVSIVAILILHYGQMFPASNVGILFLYFLVFCFSAIMMCYMVSTLFTQTSLAILASLIVYLISYLPFIVLFSVDTEMTFWQKSLACLSSTSAFGFSAKYLAYYEQMLVGIQWDNIRTSLPGEDGVTFSWCCIMMLIDGFIYGILGWYIRHVKPGKYGLAQPWYFPVCPNFWGCCTSSSSAGRYLAPSEQDMIEPAHRDAPVAMSIKGLTKTFGSFSGKQKAVDNLFMEVYGGEVTALLGHNGAAKTTTMNMILGLLAPTSGEVRVLNRPQHKMKHNIGVCPQHNALFTYMTVEEHMEFYLSVKSNSSVLDKKEEIRQLLKDVDLWHCRHSRIDQLSGGMQRRLCVALAFVGGSRVVVLDEPTSGVDPNGRRAIWNLIIRNKAGAAILLSTHHLDEADVLGDRVAIMHQGKLLCSGSPMFLKQNLASGHRLTIVTTAAKDPDPVPLLGRIARWVQGVKLQEVIGSEMTFVLPTTEHSHFYTLFRDLEENHQELGIVNIGISDPTLEEVFLKLCLAADMGRTLTADTVKQEDVATITRRLSYMGEKEDKGNGVSTIEVGKQIHHERVTGASWKAQQCTALFLKRFHHYRRNWRMFISVILLPVIMFLVAMAFTTLRPDRTNVPNKLLTPPMYGPNNYVFVKDSSYNVLSTKIMDSFSSPPGIGTTCMDDHKNIGKPFECVASTAYTSPSAVSSSNASCHCNDYRYTCDVGAAGTPPPQRVTPTTDILQDLGTRDVNDYLLKSFPEFIEKRYGGWEFEDGDSTALPSDMKATVWFNNKGHHALPSFYNSLSNAVLRSAVNNPEEYGITAFNHPFKLETEQLSRETLIQNAADFGISLVILVAFTFIPIGFALYVVNEKTKKEKHLQFISGVGPCLYWFVGLLWDMVMYCIPLALCVAIMAIFKYDVFWARMNAEAIVVLLILYGWATITLTYLVARLFTQPSTAYFTIFCTLNFLGILTMSIVFALNFFKNFAFAENMHLKDAYEVCRYVFLVFPPYCLAGGLLDMTTNQIQTTIFERFGVDVYINPFSTELLGWNLVALAAVGLLAFILNLLIDVKSCFGSSSSSDPDRSDSRHTDEDVQQEKRDVTSAENMNNPLLINSLSKVYKRDGQSFHAVDHVNFSVPRGQCFGLLGVNGAGKTTTFRMLTGEVMPTAGKAYVNSHRVYQGSTDLGQDLGYCPQEESLDSFLTVEETLHCYGRLRGLPSSTRKQAVDDVMDALDLKAIRGKTVKNCSGGMRRKLSLGIALIGDPNVILLDEPTSGMDPATKRRVWKALNAAKSRNQAVILTSHSMEECDALCTRLSIMVNGQMKCLGTPQHLKDKFGSGYTVTMYVSGLSTMKSRILELIHNYFPGAGVRDHHQNVIQLDIPREATRISTIFGVLEDQKERYNILYYTVAQTTLNTIFLNFAREQSDCGVVESDDSGSSSIETGSDTNLTSAHIQKGNFAYMNPGYHNMADKGEKLAPSPYHIPYSAHNPEYVEGLSTRL